MVEQIVVLCEAITMYVSIDQTHLVIQKRQQLSGKLEGPKELHALNNADAEPPSVCINPRIRKVQQWVNNHFFTTVRKCNIGCFDSLSKVL